MPSIHSLAKSLAYRCGFSLRRLRQAKKLVGKDGDTGERVRDLLHRRDPYSNFDPGSWPDDVAGWGSDSPAFGELIDLIRPARVIEVGTWKGGSALTMARELSARNSDAEIVCVDTWLGALEMWMDLGDDTRYGALDLRHGFPSLYYRFLANVARAGEQDRITPFPVPSVTAAQWCALRGIRADLVYIDASHEEDDVYQDLVVWWDQVRAGGVLFGDDWTWDGVRLAVQRFAGEERLTVRHSHDKWFLKKEK
ncbi:MAG: class I SAM-dependent methyltransferase [Verrucomicrobia bacterium]|nr:class I SAM-dependent methyltransferase [Verrucomicrobiota bacterium]